MPVKPGGDGNNSHDGDQDKHSVSALPYLFVAMLALAALGAALPSLLESARTLPPGVQPEAGATPQPGTRAVDEPSIFETLVPPPNLTPGVVPTNGLPLGQSGPWTRVFEDEFDGSGVDTSKWSTCYPWFDPAAGCSNAGNHELQWYTPEGVSVSDGAATLTAAKRPQPGSDGTTYDYASGMLSSGASPSSPARFVFQYGYVEARLKIPAGRGVWPAFWLAPEDGSWPPEVDIAERVGGTRPERIDMVVHYPLPDGGHSSDITQFSGPDFETDWHVFGLSWTADALVWYIDGVEQKRFTNVGRLPHKPMYLVLTLAILGNKPPDALVTFPKSMQIDYVRVWQR